MSIPNRIVDLFLALDPEQVRSRGPSFLPDPGVYICRLVPGSIIYNDEGLRFTTSDNQEIVRPTISMRFEVAEGPFAGQSFWADRLALSNPQEIPSQAGQRAYYASISRFVSNLSVILGRKIDVPDGLITALEDLEAILNEQGSILVSVRVSYGRPSRSGYRSLRVNILSRLSEDDGPAEDSGLLNNRDNGDNEGDDTLAEEGAEEDAGPAVVYSAQPAAVPVSTPQRTTRSRRSNSQNIGDIPV